ncbi:hypothetical protein BLOT_005984 [Blomia tropicalis]|nr:hypothetical protein BLOT_005984 [Blomia tropicalis]
MSEKHVEPLAQPHHNDVVSRFDEILIDISQNNPREHKRLRFVNKNMIDLSLVETKLNNYLEANLSVEQLTELSQNLDGCDEESRLCEYLLQLIHHSEERIDRHVELFQEVCNVVRRMVSESDSEMVEYVVEKCSLMIYDSFHFLCEVKRLIADVSAIYQVPYYFETGDSTIRLRSSLLSTYKNLNVIIDDMVTLSETLWVLRNFDSLSK